MTARRIAGVEHTRLTSLAILLVTTTMLHDARACSVCAAGDPTLSASGTEQPYSQRLRVDLDLLVGRVDEGAVDGRWLAVDDRRVALTVSYAPTRNVILSLVAPMLDRTLFDEGRATRMRAAGDMELRAFGLAWRDVGASRGRLGLVAGIKLPTAPIERDDVGAPLPAELQPGCSSLVPYLGVSYGAGRGVVTWQTSVAVYLPLSVRDAPHPGDSLRGSGWIQIQPTRAIGTRVGARARVDGSGELSPGVADLNSGGFVGYITSDVVVSPVEDLVLSLGLAVPIAQAWLGEHRETTVVAVEAAYDF